METVAYTVSAVLSLVVLSAAARWAVRIRNQLLVRPRILSQLLTIIFFSPAPWLILVVAILVWYFRSSLVFMQIVGGVISAVIAAAALLYISYRRQKSAPRNVA